MNLISIKQLILSIFQNYKKEERKPFKLFKNSKKREEKYFLQADFQ